MSSVMADIEAADAVVVNGEGTIHHGQGLEYVALLSIAKERGKGVLLINAVFQSFSADPAILNKLDDFTVRDQLSLNSAKSLGIRCRFLPDSILEASFDPRLHRDFDGGVVVTDWVKTRASDVGAVSSQLLADHPFSSTWFQPMHAIENRQCWQHFVASFATADAVVTSRHHAIYLAVLAGTPFVAFRSSTWKIEGLLESLQLSAPLCSSYQDVIEGLKWAQKNKSAFLAARDRLLSFRPLDCLSSLGSAGKSREEEEVAQLKVDIENQHKSLTADELSNAKRRMREQAQLVNIFRHHQTRLNSTAPLFSWRKWSKMRKRLSQFLR